MKKSKSNKPENVEIKELSSNSSPLINIRLPKSRLNAKHILRIHSALISSFINNEIDSKDAKDLSYLCSNYLTALNSTEIEERLKNIENKLNEK